jgi:hypothetical protein
MRFRSSIAALVLSAAPSFAQTTSTPVAMPSAPVSGPAAVWGLRFQLWLLRLAGTAASLPPISAFTAGNRLIPADSAINGPVGVKDGSLDVFGTVTGTVIVIDGNLRIHPGAHINGDALAVRGRVSNQGGAVSGEARSLSTLSFDNRAERPGPPRTTTWALKLTLAWFGVLVIIGVGVMIFAETNLDGVVIALERGIGRSFLFGILGQVAALPVLLLLCVALALTIIGALLIPFAVVAYFIAAAGLVTLGFLAVARLSGIPAVRSHELTARGGGVHLESRHRRSHSDHRRGRDLGGSHGGSRRSAAVACWYAAPQAWSTVDCRRILVADADPGRRSSGFTTPIVVRSAVCPQPRHDHRRVPRRTAREDHGEGDWRRSGGHAGRVRRIQFLLLAVSAAPLSRPAALAHG